MKNALWATIFIFYLGLSLSGCYKVLPPITTKNQATKYFEKICKEEYNLPVTSHFAGRTLIVYVPINKTLFRLEAAKPDPFKNDTVQDKMTILYQDVAFDGKALDVKYDIRPLKSYPNDLGYTAAADETLQKMSTNLINAVYRSFADIKDDPKATLEEKRPEFIHIYLADIINGIQYEYLLYFEDYIESAQQVLAYDEFAQRNVYEITGNRNIIGDSLGQHLEIKSVTWPEFIRRQIKHRINYKYTRSSFPPSENTEQEILKAVEATMHAYDYKIYETVDLHDLYKNATTHYTREEINEFK